MLQEHGEYPCATSAERFAVQADFEKLGFASGQERQFEESRRQAALEERLLNHAGLIWLGLYDQWVK